MNARRKILVNPRLQGKITAVFVGTALSCFAVQLALQTMAVATVASNLSQDPNAASRQLMEILMATSGVGVLLLVPLSIFAGLLVTFRIAGPIYRIESYLEARIRGEDQGVLKIRTGDECQRLCSLLNQVLNPSEDSEQAPSACELEDDASQEPEEVQETSTNSA